MEIGQIMASVEEMVSRPFPDAAPDVSDWLEGVGQSGAGAHFVPVAVFESLYETPADYDLTAAAVYAEVYERFEGQRQEIAAAMTALWGPPRRYTFRAEYDRVLAGDGNVSGLAYDLAMFAGEDMIPAWSRHDRIVTLLLGQMDKEFPIVLTVAVIRPGVGGPAAAS
ncbi:hypothetical protein [Actinoplanes sp. G11-F43]|uniref:hypothetical protein n=1 Tax=Actinoplanes sp. G11-F43 TaxID=3424130 RepID=UPI003D333D98